MLKNDAVLALFFNPSPFSGCLQPDNTPKFCPVLWSSEEDEEEEEK